MYDIASDSWLDSGLSLPNGIADFCGVEDAGKVFIMGGAS